MRGFGRASTLLAAMLLACPSFAAAPSTKWIASWGSAQMVPTGENALPSSRTRDVTIRQIVRLSAGGERLRIRFSNLFGSEPLVIGAAHVARPAPGGALRLGTGGVLRFAGRPGISIAPGAEAYSDPVAMVVEPGADLAISLHVAGAIAGQTGHPGARATSYLAAGDHAASIELPGAEPTTRWFNLADVEVTATDALGTVVAIGDSITDGYGVAPDSHTRWTDTFATRLRGGAATRGIGVVNAGIGGNRVLLDGLGPNLLARFDRDVIARSGVKWAILLEGVNDLGVLTREKPATPEAHAAIVAQVTQAYTQLAARAHAHGIKLYAGTILPFASNDYYHPGSATEADRQAINAFIRTSGVFDAVIDFDRIMRDPARPDRLAPAFDSGDGLHPSMTGYRTMGEAIPLALFADRATPAAKLALTFDDLPEHGPYPPGVTMSDTVTQIATALKAAGVKEAYGFINAGRAATADGARALAAWRAKGYPLANHGLNHRDLRELDAPAFERELVANEATLRRLAGKQDWHWFRYPFLSEGMAPTDRDAARAVLKRHGYRIAAVTMDFGDYAWNGAYARCLAKRDDAAIAALEASYLDAGRIAAIRSRAAAAAAYGGDIPYVLLMHVGAFDARMLPRLLAQYRSMGFDFVPLAEAQAHPAYARANDPALPGPSIDSGPAESVALARAPLPDTVCA